MYIPLSVRVIYLNGELVLFGFVSQRGDPFLDVGVVHVLDVSQHWHHQSLQQ